MATRSGLEKWHPEFFDKYRAVTVFDLLLEYIETGRIKIDKSKLTGRATYHDPCNYGRKSMDRFGRAFFAEGRKIMDYLFDEWVEGYPSGNNQYCCGGGGGTLLTPYSEERLLYGERKIEQIKRTGADTVVAPCHSCHGQIKSVLMENGLKNIEVKYLWELVAEALV